MATSLRQLQTQKQKLAPRQVLQARLLQLNTVNLEQAILAELEQNPLLELQKRLSSSTYFLHIFDSFLNQSFFCNIMSRI